MQFRETLAATVLVAVALMASVAARAPQAPRTAQPAVQTGAARDGDTGRATYTKLSCEVCHGAEGVGTAAGPRIAAGALPLPAFIGYVRKPTGTMPAQTAQALPDKALSEVYAFLHSPAILQAQNRPGPVAGSAEAGAVLYKKNGCYECHVDNAQGGPQGPRLGPNPIPLPRFLAYVRRPAGEMPPFTAKVISDQDLTSIHVFLQARPVPPPVDSIPLLAP